MEKSTAFLILMVGALSVGSTSLRAEEQPREQDSTTAPSTPPDQQPVYLASALPGMRPVSKPLLERLPGMRPLSAPSVTPSAAEPLPRELISGLTNVPNPFDSRKGGWEGQTQIRYQLTLDASVSITLYDLLGHKVRSWDFKPGENGGKEGDNRITWDGTNEAGDKVSKGGYIAQLTIETPTTVLTAVRKIGVIH